MVLRESCGLVDRSSRGKLALTGAQAKEFLNGQITNDVTLLEPGTGLYAAFLTHKGKMQGDVRVLDLGDELWLDTERSGAAGAVRHDPPLQDRLRRGAAQAHAGVRAAVADRPARAGGRRRAGAAVGRARSMRALRGGAQVVLVATADGIDVICAAGDADAVKAALVAAGAVEVSEQAAELVRVEQGRPRFGVDIDDTTIPQEAGLNERAVSFTKGCYVGQETVARLYYKGKPNRHLRGLRLSGEGVATGDALRLGEREVGRLGSVTRSPTLGPIALAIVRREAEPGATVTVGDGGATATVVELPFA